MSVSRMVPPPIPVAVPSRTKPTRSISLREATSAPVVAKTTIPNQSSRAAKVSNISHVPIRRGQNIVIGCRWGREGNKPHGPEVRILDQGRKIEAPRGLRHPPDRGPGDGRTAPNGTAAVGVAGRRVIESSSRSGNGARSQDHPILDRPDPGRVLGGDEDRLALGRRVHHPGNVRVTA